SPNPANTGQLVTVSFTGSDIDGSISSIGVNWGDGTPTHNLAGTATSDAHSYTATGTFTITIVATDNSGSTGQVTGSVTVNIPTGISTGFNFWSVSWKQDGSYALIGGSVGLLLEYDGVSVTQISNPGGTTILSMSWHPSGTYVVLSGKSGGFRTYDGSTIKSFDTGTTNDLNTAA